MRREPPRPLREPQCPDHAKEGKRFFVGTGRELSMILLPLTPSLFRSRGEGEFFCVSMSDSISTSRTLVTSTPPREGNPE